MAIHSVEARIVTYSDGQLTGVRRSLDALVSKLTYGTKPPGCPSLARIISAWPQITEAHRLADETVDPEDVTLLLRATRDCKRLYTLGSLREQLDSEAARRQLSG